MSLKRFFEDKSKRIVKLVDYKATEDLLAEDSYSHDFIVSKELTLRRFIPRVDYSDPKNFAFFGNAERYYEDSIKRIHDTYPYDDSPYEKEQWFLSSSYLDLHILRNDYPSSTGYATLSPSGWSARTAVSGAYGEPTTKEYIYVKGGPHKNNNYDPAKNRESNLKIDGAKGNTIEFFLKKSEFVDSLTEREVIFDCATNDSDISEFGDSYGRFRVEMTGSASGSPFLVTYSSGSSGVINAVVGNSVTKSTVADGNWHHYAVSVKNEGSDLQVSLYVDGVLDHTVLTGSTCGPNEVNFHANVGSLVKKISSTSTTAIGWGKLSGSLDEFRFWKQCRTAEQIGSNWRHQVAGGTNFGEVTADLGVYYKFNEGITTDASVDNVVLDYSGRISNGAWIGYSSTSRDTGSAITESGANTEEFKDPIIRSNHPLVVSLLADKKSTGRSHDMLNSSALYNTFPNWMTTEDTDAYKGSGKLAELVQIISSYFDTLYLQTKVLPGLKDKGYTDYPTPQHLSGSKPSPFSDKLLRSAGFVAPELFVESNVVDRILGQDANRVFEEDLSDIKNLIYKNIYNNLVRIYKTKGTESSFRNLLRCFGIDDELIKLNMYASGYTYKFEDSYLYKSEKVKGINFNNPSYFGANVHQQTSSYGSTHYMSGNTDAYTPYTFGADVIMPLKLESGQTGFFETNFVSSSIFGMHTPALTAGDTTFDANDPAGIQVYAVHHPSRFGAAKFVLTSSKGNVPHLETQFYEDVYDDKHWNISVRVRPTTFPWAATAATGSTYTVEFSGYNYIVDELQESFELSGTATFDQLSAFSRSRKSLYVGANRSNFTSTVQQSSDVIINSARVWQGYLNNTELKSHALSFNEYGRQHPSRNAYLFETGSNSTEINQAATMVLHWNFDQVTGSDASGEFFVADISRQFTGSFGSTNTALNTYHGGTGYGFPVSTTDMVRGMSLAVAKENLPENIFNSSLVTVETHDKERLTRDSRPINYYFAFEKSMYQTISEEMVKMFATVADFNNLVGDPVNKYRPTYKKMDHLRSMFFANVDADPDLDKYVEFYKWFDVSMAMMLDEIRPATMPGSDGIKNMVESHVLERSKYQHRAPTLEFKDKTPEANILGVNELLYDWEHGHAPVAMSNPDAAVGTITTTGNPGNNETFTLTDGDGLSVTYVFKTGVATVDGSKDGDNVIIGVSGATGHAPSVGDRMRAAIIASDLNVTVVETAGGSMSLTQNTKGAQGNTEIDMTSVATVSATDFTGGTGTLEQDNCLWWKDRAERDAVLSVATTVDSDREAVKQRINTVVSGSTYVIRKLTRPYRLTMDKNILIDPGSNVATNKINNLHQGVIKFGSTSDAIELSAADLQEQVVCNDVFGPNQKERLHGKMDSLGTDGYLDADSDMIAPFSLYSSSVGDTALATFKAGVALTNNHGDSYHIDGQLPLQGLFTSQYVGGKAHRDVEISVSSPELRPEAYAIEVTSGKIKIVHQPTDRPRSMFYRNEMIRRPVNLRNIRTTTGSYKVGNYREVYEYALTNGRRENNNDFALNNGYTGSLYSSVAALATGILDQPKPNRSKNKHVIVNRFSAPGGTEVMGDANGGPNLDFAAGEYSVYNTMNHRNSLVREVKNDLDVEYSERFGLRSGSSIVSDSYELASGSQNGFASVHMTNRNEKTRNVVSSTANWNTKAILFDGASDFLEIDETRAIYKNDNEFSVFAWVKHPAVDVAYQHTIWSHHDSGGTNRNIFGIKGTATAATQGTLFFYQEGHSWQFLSTERVDDGNWHLVGFTYEGTTNTVRLFLDGKAQPGAITISNIADQTNSTNDKVSIGQEYDGGSQSDFFKGHMSDFSIWSKALTSNEVYEIYSDGEYLGPHDLSSHTATTSLSAWYRMGDGDNGSGTDDAYNGSIYDMSSNSYAASPQTLASDAIEDVSSELPGTYSIYETRQQRDNAFVQHPIPRNDLQYRWIADATTETRNDFIGYQHDFTEPRAIDSIHQREIGLIGSSKESADGSGTYWSDFVGLNLLQRVGGAPSWGSDATDLSWKTSTLTLRTKPGSWSIRTHIPKLSPYGWNSWKQLRVSQHPIARYNRKNNLISLHVRDDEINTSPLMTYQRPHNIDDDGTSTKVRGVKLYPEPAVTSQYKPMELMFGVISDDQFGELRDDVLGHQGTGATFAAATGRAFGEGRAEVRMKMTYGNNLCKFAGKDLMDKLGLNENGRTTFDAILENMKKPGGVMTPTGFRYSETIYPIEDNLYMRETRQRTTFVSREWRETRAGRIQNLYKTPGSTYSDDSLDMVYFPLSVDAANSQDISVYSLSSGGYITQSLWPLDERTAPTSRPAYLLSQSLDWTSNAGYDARRIAARANDDTGELQNSYSTFHNGPVALYDYFPNAPVGAVYNRRIPQTVTDGAGEIRTFLAGESKWELETQSGKGPFEKDYDAWAEELRVAQDFSLVPEFKISDHIKDMLKTGDIETPLESFLSLSGSQLRKSDSSSSSFFATYSNTDFMKYFRVVKESLSDLNKEPKTLFLECKAMLKMLPYEGFYPATRTLKLCSLFQEEYTDFDFDAREVAPDQSASQLILWEAFRQLKTRHSLLFASKFLYAPGVLYNSIKSGIAVDYPIFKNIGTGSYNTAGSQGYNLDTPSEVRTAMLHGANPMGQGFTGSYLTTDGGGVYGMPRIKSSISKRVSFEDLLNPDVLDGTLMYDNEPHPSASWGVQVFGANQAATYRDGIFDLYPVYGRIFSGSEVQPDYWKTTWGFDDTHVTMGSTKNFSLAMNNFAAEVPNFFLKNESLTTLVSNPGPFKFGANEIGTTFKMQVQVRNRDIIMYDNPSAFGPPVDNNPDVVASYKYGFAPYTPGFLKKGSVSQVEVEFTPNKESYTLHEIFGESTSSYSSNRLEHRGTFAGTNKTAQMPLSASFNLFSSVLEPNTVQDENGNIIEVADPTNLRHRWVIQSKWETPVLDFSNASQTLYDATGSTEVDFATAYGSLTAPSPWSAHQSAKGCYLTSSRGIWHQYGDAPTEGKGYEISLRDVKDSMSLASKVGFPVGQATKLGQVAEKKEISEAVVAVPYFIESDQLTFCDLDPEDVREVMGELDVMRGQIAMTPGVHPAIRHQLEMMQKYIFPPQLDFLKYRDKSPMAMYVFEFKHDLSKKDLTDLWQNLPPSIGQHAEGTQTTVVGHNLVKNGQVLDPLSGRIADKMQWMVFKVKKRAESSYFKKLNDSVFQTKGRKVDVFREGRNRSLVASSLEEIAANLDGYSYNWPYDYFSLVELIKLDASVVFRDKT